jgi:hypothetical protein
MTESTVEKIALEKTCEAINSTLKKKSNVASNPMAKEVISPVDKAPIALELPWLALIKRNTTLSKPKRKKTLKKANIETANKNKPDSAAPSVRVTAAVIKKAANAATTLVKPAKADCIRIELVFMFTFIIHPQWKYHLPEKKCLYWQ